MKVRNLLAHVYTLTGVIEEPFVDIKKATEYCAKQFKMYNVYKVKLWDLDLGDPEPNNPNAKGLIIEFV